MQIASATNTIVNTANRNAGGRVPSFPSGNVLFTREPLQRCEDEIIRDIWELAKRNVARRKNLCDVLYDSDFRELQREFTSPYSPDRKGAINSKLSSLGRQMGAMGLRFNLANFFLVLFQNAPLFRNEDIFSNGMVFRDSNGHKIAGFDTHIGWHSFWYPAEDARIMEFKNIYREAALHARKVLSGFWEEFTKEKRMIFLKWLRKEE